MAKRPGELLQKWVEVALCYHDLRHSTNERAGFYDGLGKAKEPDITVLTATEVFPDGFFVECKWQSSEGTAYEKLWKTASDAKKHYTKPTFIVADGMHDIWAKIREDLRPEIGGNFRGAVSLFEFEQVLAGLSGRAPRQVAMNNRLQPMLF